MRITALSDVASGMPGGSQYIRFAAALSTAAVKSIRLGFHGTASSNVDTIARDGLNVEMRKAVKFGVGDYFAERLDVALPYSQGARRVLVFALLMEESGLTYHGRDMIVIHKVEHEVPICIVEIEHMGSL